MIHSSDREGVRALASVALADQRRVLRTGLDRFVWLTAALAIVGAFLVAPLVLGADGAHPTMPSDPARGRTDELNAVVSTTFGTVAVAYVEKIPGLTAKDLAGMTHGIADLVPAGQEMVQVSATISNRSDVPIAYSPERFSVRLEDGRRVAPSTTASVPGVLQPDASIDLRIDFVVPGDGRHVWLRFADGARTREIDLGPTLVSDGGGGHGHAS
jgi:hypothetical protein